jgi:hypothetical protein
MNSPSHDLMELCILKFGGAHAAEKALDAVLVVTPEWLPWLYDISVVSRSRFGQLTITPSHSLRELARFEHGEDVAEEEDSDLTAPEIGAHTRFLLGPLVTPSWSSAADSLWHTINQAFDMESQLFHRGALKDLLSRDSSALLLVADTSTCRCMVRLFAPHQPGVVCRPLGDVSGRELDEPSSAEDRSEPDEHSDDGDIEN